MGPISVDQMYRIEEAGHAMGFYKKFMMENAGAAAVRRLLERAPVEGRKIQVLCGMGNNGGDGMVMARHLAGHGAKVSLELMGDPKDLRTEESRWNWSLLERMKSVALEKADASYRPDIVIDAMLGTGISGAVREPYASAISRLNASACLKVAVDVPSGLDPQTGQASDPVARCDMTVTFHRMKEGIPARPDLTGAVYVERIGIPPEAQEGIL